MGSSNSKQVGPDRRVNTTNERNALEFATPRGNLQLKRVDDIVARSPPPPTERPEKRMFPKEYRNVEHGPDGRRENFDRRWIQQGRNPGDPRDMKMYEYPVKTLVQPAPFKSEFDFTSPSASLRDCKAPPPKELEAIKEYWMAPLNDPGPLRAVVNKDQEVVGAIYHPKGDTRGYERARVQPLDAHGRGELARYKDTQVAGRTTWPQRGTE
ncbi:hypothetical protein MYCTH_2305546 [Thermothelomyces thermophilus ATCC 42464]|uniref:Uncharacterized protein n=1 Tax=Thermothelomyces thermophilus (strain ATCC 42464 / BCRC 31852 / DSM 1799) TaxID=573729 RepID=G2QDD0_THET4|nr:uncharacterized protein MYCTH_2305546 [Thermothelomyces thermophilus ATCC 42464]AEO58295.1 hypothetical protein MYCTH_2305546 [Thermothelomyces thermophilus ATCC 42464]